MKALQTSLFILLAACLSCAPKPNGTHGNGTGSADGRFAKAADAFYWAHIEARPTLGVYLGYHQYDGKMPVVDDASLKAEIVRLEQGQKTLSAFQPATLSKRHQIERDVLLFEIRSELFEMRETRAPWRNPTWYGWGMSVANYVTRDYKSREERAKAIIAVADNYPAFLGNVKANLAKEIPLPWLETGLLQCRGNIEFIKTDVRKVFKGLSDPRLEQQLGAALDKIVAELEKYATFLEARKPHANQEYALGEEMFLRMLAETQGVKIDLAALEAIAQADLERNLAAMEAAAREIDSKKSVAEVVAMVNGNKPDPDKVLAEAEAQAKRMRAHLIEKKIVTIPSDDVAQVKASPPFMRWNFAFLSGAGPFEKKKLPSFYYISPPDPSWSAEDQREYVPGKTDLLATTIHELWPGHFLHGLHSKQIESPILKSFWNYAMGEGWAHYTEEMMVVEGADGGGPEVRVGQLTNALLRDVRFLSAIGLHAKGMTIEESQKLFAEKAFQDPGNARQQAVRGARDPMYLSYTLGKLMIMKLREDWKAEQGDAYTLQKFHDEFLSYGGAPVPVIRKAMLRSDTPVL